MDMESFDFNAHPARVIFGRDSLKKIPAELRRLGARNVLIITTPGQVKHAQKIQAIIEDEEENRDDAEKARGGARPAASTTSKISVATIFSEAQMHTPITVTETALEVANSSQTDSILSIGGGSAIGLGKALAFRSDGRWPHVCVPTTYAGSEMTAVLGETADGRKTTKADPRVLPKVVFFDVEMTMGLPSEISAVSGMNAVAHAVEALYAPNTNPLIRTHALAGTTALSTSLPIIVSSSSSSKGVDQSSLASSDLIPSRTEAQYGAFLCAMSLATTTTGLHHKLCHVLGGRLGLPHGQTHTIVLSHVLAYNIPAIAVQGREHQNGSGGDGTRMLLELAKALRGGGGGPGAKDEKDETSVPKFDNDNDNDNAAADENKVIEERRHQDQAGNQAITALNALLLQIGWLNRGLHEFGMKETDIEGVVDEVMAAVVVDEPPGGSKKAGTGSLKNPRPVERGALVEVVRRCVVGEEARVDL